LPEQNRNVSNGPEIRQIQVDLRPDGTPKLSGVSCTQKGVPEQGFLIIRDFNPLFWRYYRFRADEPEGDPSLDEYAAYQMVFSAKRAFTCSKLLA